MRKRNKVLAWGTGVLIALLVCLLGISLLLLWGRVFAPTMPDSKLTQLWNLARNNYVIKGFMSWLRQLPCYDACCDAARKADGTLEPLNYLIGLMGCVSFAIAAINETKSSRSFGMLMSDVIHYAFPFHMSVQVLLHVSFAVIGSYACLKNIGLTAAFCFLGILICFVYSLVMAFFIYASPKAKELLVTFYINGVMTSELHTAALEESEKPKEPHKDMLQWKRNAGTCVLDYARYLGQQWTKGNILQVHRDSRWSREALLVRLIICGITADANWLKTQDYSKTDESGLNIAKDFDVIFPNAKEHKKDSAKFVLYTKALSFMYDEDIRNLQEDVRRCSQVWEQLFADVNSEKRRAQMAYAVLLESKSLNWQIFTMMTMGLLLHLGITKMEHADTEAKQTLEKKIALIYNIRLFASETIPEENLSAFHKFNDAWAEIVYLSAGTIQWMQSVDLLDKDVGEKLVFNLLGVVRKGMSTKGLAQLSHDREKYIVLSFFLFSFDNFDVYRDLTAFALQNLEPNIQDKLDCFNR